MTRWAALGALAVLVPALAGAAGARPSRSQAAAAVAEYKGVRARCPADDAACEGRARQRFVEVVSCVAQGKPSVSPATLQQDFARYVDLVSEVLDAPEQAAGAPAGPPCFVEASAGGAAPAPAGVAAPAPAPEEGPSVESLRRFRKQADEQSRPVTALPETVDPSAHERLKTDLEEIRGRLRTGAASGASGGVVAPAGPSAVPSVVPAPAPVPVPSLAPTPVPAPAGTTNITGGPSAPATTNITGGPTPPPNTGAYQLPPESLNPAQIRQQIHLQGVICQSGYFNCRGACIPNGTKC